MQNHDDDLNNSSCEEQKVMIKRVSVEDKRSKKSAKKREKKLQREESKRQDSSSTNLLSMPEWNQEDPVRGGAKLMAVQQAADSISALTVNKCSSTQIRKRCAAECSQWTLYIEKADPLSGKPPFLQKLCNMPSTNREFKIFEEPVRIESDLITEIMVKEELELVLNQDSSSLESDTRREAAMRLSSRDESSQVSYTQEYPLIREAISSVDVTNLSHDAPLQMNTGLKVASAQPVESKEARPCQSLVCLEFKIGQDPLDSLASLRQINSASFNTLFEFKLVGNVHGKSLTQDADSSEGFVTRVRGEDIAAGLMQRICDIRNKMSQVGSNMKTIERITVTAPIQNSANARFALQFNIANLKQVRGSINSVKHFLKVGAQVLKIYMQVACNYESSLPQRFIPKQKTNFFTQTYQQMFEQRCLAKQEMRKKRTFLLSGIEQSSQTMTRTQTARKPVSSGSPDYSKKSSNMNTSSPSFDIKTATSTAVTELQSMFIAPTQIVHLPRGNLQRFIDVSTPMLVSSFNKSGVEFQPTIAQLIGGISQASAKGLRFEFFELDGEDKNEEEMLVYTPTLSLFKLRFKSDQLPKVQFETSRDTIYNQLTPSAVLRAKLSDSTLSLLERTSLHEVDPNRSYFALKWQLQMSLTSKLGNKGRHRHPNFLIYYAFHVDSSQKWTRQLRVTGMQASTYGGLQRWTGLNSVLKTLDADPSFLAQMMRDQETYDSLSYSLQELVKNTMDRETHKRLVRQLYVSPSRRPSSSSSSMKNSDEPQPIKERCMHSDFYALRSEFFED